MGKINVAIIGAGNCASSLVQGLYKYSEVDETSEKIPSLVQMWMGASEPREACSLNRESKATA